MTRLLIRLFIREPDNTEDWRIRTAYGNLAGGVGIFCNMLLFFGKYLLGTLLGSIAITADAVNNLSDASGNIVSLIGFRLGAKKPDPKHPYGHARYEYLAGLVVCVIILAIGLSLAKESIGKILHPSRVVFSWITVGILLASVLVKLWLFLFYRAVGRRISSETLLCTAADSRNDVLATGAVLVSIGLSRLTGWAGWDGLTGLLVAGFILISGFLLLRDTLSPLVGEAPSRELVERIEQKVLSYPGVMGMHNLMVHDYGPGHVFVSLHVEFPAEAEVLEAHDLIDRIEHDFLTEEHLLVTIHYDPIVTKDARVAELRSYFTEAAREFDPQITIHDLRIVPGTTHTNIVFDCVLPAGYDRPEQEVLAYFEARAREKSPDYVCVVETEQDYV